MRYSKTAMTKRIVLVVAVFAVPAAVVWMLLDHEPADAPVHVPPPVESFDEYERRARSHFYRHHPGQRPLNWEVANVARRMHADRPMGTFSLHENDCSDFVDCAIDEALGYGPRYDRRGGHIGRNLDDLWHTFAWDGAQALVPGDIIRVRHSPWYPPDPDACSHVGLIGPDGMVYDWTKLKSWNQARYNRVSVSEFVRNCRVPGQVWVWRLHPKYRYRIAAIPDASPQSN
jgi:hypothetical protein